MPGARIARDTRAPRPASPGDGQPEGFRDAVLVVPHGLVVHHVDADLGESLRHPLGVVVADLAEEDLGPYAQELRPHAAGPGFTGGSGRTRRSHGIARK